MPPSPHIPTVAIGSILSSAWVLFRKHLREIVLVTLIVYIPVNIILSFVPFDALVAQMGELKAFKVYSRIIQLLEFLIGIIATMAIAYIITARMEGKALAVGDALRNAVARWPAMMGTGLLAGIALLGLTLLLIVPGIIYGVYWRFVLYVVALRGIAGKRALAYSKRMVKGRWWKVVEFAFVFGIMEIVVGVVVGAILVLLPDHRLLDIATDTVIDLALAYFTVVNLLFFLAFDRTTKADATSDDAATPAPRSAT